MSAVTFTYTGYDASGARLTGHVEGTDRAACLADLAARRIEIIRLEPAEKRVKRDHARPLGGRRRVDLETRLADWAMLVEARVPLADAIATGGHASSDSALAEVHRRVTAGRPLAEAFEALPGLPSEAPALLTAAERSGDLAPALSALALSLRRTRERRAALLEAIAYPAFLVAMMVIAIIALAFVLAPALLPLFDGEAEPPLVLVLLDGLGWALADPFVVGLVGLGLGVLVLTVRRRGVAALPVLSGAIVTEGRARYLETLASLVAHRVPLAVALEAAGATAPLACSSALLTVRDEVTGGRSLHEALRRSGAFDDRVVALIEVGERSSDLARVLARAGELLRTEAETRMMRLVSIATPAMTIAIGGLVGWLVVSVMSALLGANELVL